MLLFFRFLMVHEFLFDFVHCCIYVFIRFVFFFFFPKNKKSEKIMHLYSSKCNDLERDQINFALWVETKRFWPILDFGSVSTYVKIYVSGFFDNYTVGWKAFCLRNNTMGYLCAFLNWIVFLFQRWKVLFSWKVKETRLFLFEKKKLYFLSMFLFVCEKIIFYFLFLTKWMLQIYTRNGCIIY